MGPAALDIGTATQARRAGIGHEDARFCRHISTEVPGMFWLVAAAWRLPSPHDPPSDGRQRAAVVRSNLAALAVNKPMAAYGTELPAAMPVHRPPSEAQQTPTKPHSTILDLYDRSSFEQICQPTCPPTCQYMAQRKIRVAAAPSALRPAWSAAQCSIVRRASGPAASGAVAISVVFVGMMTSSV